MPVYYRDTVVEQPSTRLDGTPIDQHQQPASVGRQPLLQQQFSSGTTTTLMSPSESNVPMGISAMSDDGTYPHSAAPKMPAFPLEFRVQGAGHAVAPGAKSADADEGEVRKTSERWVQEEWYPGRWQPPKVLGEPYHKVTKEDYTIEQVVEKVPARQSPFQTTVVGVQQQPIRAAPQPKQQPVHQQQQRQPPPPPQQYQLQRQQVQQQPQLQQKPRQQHPAPPQVQPKPQQPQQRQPAPLESQPQYYYQQQQQRGQEPVQQYPQTTTTTQQNQYQQQQPQQVPQPEQQPQVAQTQRQQQYEYYEQQQPVEEQQRVQQECEQQKPKQGQQQYEYYYQQSKQSTRQPLQAEQPQPKHYQQVGQQWHQSRPAEGLVQQQKSQPPEQGQQQPSQQKLLQYHTQQQPLKQVQVQKEFVGQTTPTTGQQQYYQQQTQMQQKQKVVTPVQANQEKREVQGEQVGGQQEESEADSGPPPEMQLAGADFSKLREEEQGGQQHYGEYTRQQQHRQGQPQQQERGLLLQQGYAQGNQVYQRQGEPRYHPLQYHPEPRNYDELYVYSDGQAYPYQHQSQPASPQKHRYYYQNFQPQHRVHQYFSPSQVMWDPVYEDSFPDGQPPPFAHGPGGPQDYLVYHQHVNLDRRRAESEQRRRHHSPVPGAAEYGYAFGGMDYVNHTGFDAQADVGEPYDERQSRIDLHTGPPRRRGDFFGLDYTTMLPGQQQWGSGEDIHTYHGYQPLPPRKNFRLSGHYTADPEAPLNIAEAQGLDAVDSQHLVGNTLSNQKVVPDRLLSDEEKRNFALEFGAPEFKPDHRTVRPEPKPEEPVQFSVTIGPRKSRSTGAVSPEGYVNPMKVEGESWMLGRRKEMGCGAAEHPQPPFHLRPMKFPEHVPVWARDRKQAMGRGAKSVDARLFAPPWAKVPQPHPPFWVKRSNAPAPTGWPMAQRQQQQRQMGGEQQREEEAAKEQAPVAQQQQLASQPKQQYQPKGAQQQQQRSVMQQPGEEEEQEQPEREEQLQQRQPPQEQRKARPQPAEQPQQQPAENQRPTGGQQPQRQGQPAQQQVQRQQPQQPRQQQTQKYPLYPLGQQFVQQQQREFEHGNGVPQPGGQYYFEQRRYAERPTQPQQQAPDIRQQAPRAPQSGGQYYFYEEKRGGEPPVQQNGMNRNQSSGLENLAVPRLGKFPLEGQQMGRPSEQQIVKNRSALQQQLRQQQLQKPTRWHEEPQEGDVFLDSQGHPVQYASEMDPQQGGDGAPQQQQQSQRSGNTMARTAKQ